MSKNNKAKGANRNPKPHYVKVSKPEPRTTVVVSIASPSPKAKPSHEKSNHCDTVKVDIVLNEPPQSLDYTKPITLHFGAIDTLFFRETRPMESMGELQSVFPPSVRTLAGAVRSWIGEAQNVNWNNLENEPVSQVIGMGDNLGRLKFQGPWLALNSERLYPAPLNLMKKDDEIFSLKLDKPIKCDLGNSVRLPTFPSDEECYKGGKALENTWLTQTSFLSLLQGKLPTKSDLKEAKHLFERESRLGIARDNQKRGVIEGLLYQTEHVRPRTALTVELVATGLPDTLPTQTMVRLGGEGRPAHIQLKQSDQTTKVEAGAITNGKFALYLLTPLPIKSNEVLPDFTQQECTGQTVWVGELNGISLKLHSAVTGKVLREGGWDMAKHAPRKVTNFIPAGSVFYFELVDGIKAEKAINQLHDKKIGCLTEYGFGHVVVGVWNDK